MTDIVEKLKERVKNPALIIDAIGQVRLVAQLGTSKSYFYKGLKPVITIEDLDYSEQRLGFQLPKLLRRIYLEVGNGGFGPGYGMLGLKGGATDGQGFTGLDL